MFTGVRSSLPSLSGRHASVNSYLSSAERIGRRSSDVTDSGRDTKSSSSNSYLVKKEVTFSPIHECNEEALDICMAENAVAAICVDLNMMNEVSSEELQY